MLPASVGAGLCQTFTPGAVFGDHRALLTYNFGHGRIRCRRNLWWVSKPGVLVDNQGIGMREKRLARDEELPFSDAGMKILLAPENKH